MSWEVRISFLITYWIEKISTLKALRISVKNENRLSQEEKPTKLPNKKMKYVIDILLMSASPISIEVLMEILEYRHKDTFRQNYIKPLEALSFIRKTNPEKPTASNHKYLITEKGKRFLTGKDD